MVHSCDGRPHRLSRREADRAAEPAYLRENRLVDIIGGAVRRSYELSQSRMASAKARELGLGSRKHRPATAIVKGGNAV
jgi:hypothetical protein